ncbi:BREX-1 system adenine-specific DNA-methyltransferase PglX [Candidatus Methanoprimaticola sp. MG2]|uniref:BREX-1 system adenine-specific DNA-methyltransferase PglX n=1 Tax=Candidatus Methanoprimaticola sp. MG2 TaxID=3228838 RepID=UPI0039C7250C
MDRAAVERFSIEARRKLRQSVDSAMADLGVGEGHDMVSIESAGDITIITLKGGLQTRITRDEANWREKLIEAIDKSGYDNIVEQVAYTWFNRLIAVRYMEVNDYLPTHVRVLSSTVPGKDEPDLVTRCTSVDLGISSSEMEDIIRLRDSDKLDDLFSRMFIHQCKVLNRILPELFTVTKPYENLLLRLSYTNPDGVVRDLVDNVPEEDFRDAVQIIGWMYQYYNSEVKDEVFANLKKNVKISKERIPAATQLFTPDWIVRYMVENSVGRVWLDGHDDPNLRKGWRYYVDEAQQEPEVAAALKEQRKPRQTMMPSDIKVIDPCMGSGHVLVYAFDVLMQIYDSFGYSKQDAVDLIVTDNIYGLDIDDRAYQLAYFAVMMKARQYDPNVFSKGLKPNLHSIPESNGIDESALEGYGTILSAQDSALARNEIMYLLSVFRDAKTYGSLLRIRKLNWDNIGNYLKGRTGTLFSNPELDATIREIVDVARVLTTKFDAIITNPPYLSSSGMNPDLSKFVKDAYPDSKSDLFACFIERCLEFSGKDDYVSMITQHAFMFLSSFEMLRSNLRKKSMVMSMAHLGPHAFDQIGGEVVQSVSFTLCNEVNQDHVGTYCRLIDGYGEAEKENLFLSGDNRYFVKQSRFDAIPGAPIAYWFSKRMISCFAEGQSLDTIVNLCAGLATGNNDVYQRSWFEVDYRNIGFGISDVSETTNRKERWYPCNSGGKYRKWYPADTIVVDWKNNGESIKHYRNKNGKLAARPQNTSMYFKEGFTWNKLSSSEFAVRYKRPGFIFDDTSRSAFICENYSLDYCIGLLSSNVTFSILKGLNPTMSFTNNDISRIPMIYCDEEKNKVVDLVRQNIALSKEDWDSQELSWNYDRCFVGFSTVSEYVEEQVKAANKRYNSMRSNERELNSIFIEIYQLEDELSKDDASPTTTELIDSNCAVKRLISHAIGCMFGRYSLESHGLQFAGGEWIQPDREYPVDSDNIIPINDNDYFGDDIVTRFVDFIRIVFGEENLEENLKFIASALEIKGSGIARDKIRKYFLNDFYKDHLKMYSNLPIYWLFDSGKENGFKALIYMHRYDENLIGKMRQNYLLPMQKRYTEQFDAETDSVVRSKLQKKLDEIAVYDLAMELYSSDKVSINLDDGVKVNYAKFQNIDNPGGKGKINLLYKLK